MGKITKAYKVVRVLGNSDRVSVVATKKGWKKSYIHNGKVVPVDNAFVFDNLDDAIRFAAYNEIWECEGINCRKPRYMLNSDYIIAGWRPVSLPRNTLLKIFGSTDLKTCQALAGDFWVESTPKGTILLDQVKLTKNLGLEGHHF
jgi:hypothetical protein